MQIGQVLRHMHVRKNTNNIMLIIKKCSLLLKKVYWKLATANILFKLDITLLQRLITILSVNKLSNGFKMSHHFFARHLSSFLHTFSNNIGLETSGLYGVGFSSIPIQPVPKAAGKPIMIDSETPAITSCWPWYAASNKWSAVFSNDASIRTDSFILARP